MSQLADFVRARKLFAYGEVRDYWDHPNCVGYVEEAINVFDTNQYLICRWVRTGEEGRDGCAVLMCNGDEGWGPFCSF